jgi:ABC-type lipoprotein export system ATPase subunit
VIEIRDMHFRYGDAEFALAVPELDIAKGERVAFVGPSGSGKTTLVSLIAGIVGPQSGSIKVDGAELVGKRDTELRDFRISKIGFIFQEFELLDYLSALDNILLPFLINRSLKLDGETRESAHELASSVGLGGLLDRHPQHLSHGERQRLAICRALVTRPEIVIADEPTGNLDPGNTSAIMDTILAQVADRGATLVMVTHDHSLLESLDRSVDLGEFVVGAGTGKARKA